MFDIVIVGFGPAGAMLARLLDKRFSVAAIDRRDAQGNGFEKPCGGLLAPDAQKALARTALSIPAQILCDPQLFAVKTLDLHAGLLRYYQRFYMNIDRQGFDLWLRSLSEKRVSMHQGHCTGIDADAEGYTVRYEHGGERRELRARCVVGADGAASIVRRAIGARPIRQYVCIQEWFEHRPVRPFYEAYFDARLTDCYAWGNYKNGHFILGAALPKQNPRQRFAQLKAGLEGYGYEFGEVVRREACLVSRPKSVREIELGSGDMLLVGEAAGFVSPSSLEGISYAFESAFALAEALNRGGDTLANYRQTSRPIRRQIARKLWKVPFMYWPLLRRLMMRSELEAVEPDQRPEE